MDRFPYLEHNDNVAIALKVCELNGVNKKIALEGMLCTSPDPGATIIWELDFSGTKNTFVTTRPEHSEHRCQADGTRHR